MTSVRSLLCSQHKPGHAADLISCKHARSPVPLTVQQHFLLSERVTSELQDLSGLWWRLHGECFECEPTFCFEASQSTLVIERIQ